MSELKNTNGNSFSKFNKMSTEELDEILRLDFQLPDGEGLDEDTILYITEVIASREKSPSHVVCPDVDAAWEDLISKYLPDGTNDLLGNGEETKPVQSPKQLSPAISRHSRSIRWMLRIVSVAAILAVLFFATTITAYALGYDVWGAIASWSQETFSFVQSDTKNNTDQTDPSNSGSVSSEFSSLQEALDSYGITATIAPTWIPERFSLDSVSASKNDGLIVFNTHYSCEDSILVISVICHEQPQEQYAQWQKDDVTPTIYEADGTPHYIMTNMGRQKAVWFTSNCECSITGDISEDELLTIIDSIYERGI